MLRYVVRNRIHVDIGSLCHLLDRLCGLFSLSAGYQTRRLHNVILPRSWLHELWMDFDEFKDQVRGYRSYDIVMASIRQLLREVYANGLIPGMHFFLFPVLRVDNMRKLGSSYRKVHYIPLRQAREMAVARM